MASIEEKQIAKEILLKAIDRNMLDLYDSSSGETSAENLAVISNAFKQILESVSK